MKKNEWFKMLLPFDDKMAVANVREESNPVQIQYNIKFSNGYKNTFFPVEESDDWGEETLGITKLSQAVGLVLDEYLGDTKNYMEPFTGTIDGDEYVVQPYGEIDQVLFKVYKDGDYLFTVQIGDDAQWEIMAEVALTDEAIIEKYAPIVNGLGNFIDQKTLT